MTCLLLSLPSCSLVPWSLAPKGDSEVFPSNFVFPLSANIIRILWILHVVSDALPIALIFMCMCKGIHGFRKMSFFLTNGDSKGKYLSLGKDFHCFKM